MRKKSESNSNQNEKNIIFNEITSRWLFAWIDHSSLVANIRPHSSHVQDSGWFVVWFCIEAIFVCWLLFVDWLCMPPCSRLFGGDSWCKWACIKFCLFSLFVDFFFISKNDKICFITYLISREMYCFKKFFFQATYHPNLNYLAVFPMVLYLLVWHAWICSYE